MLLTTTEPLYMESQSQIKVCHGSSICCMIDELGRHRYSQREEGVQMDLQHYLWSTVFKPVSNEWQYDPGGDLCGPCTKICKMQMSIKASVVTQDLEYMDWEEPRSVLSYMMWARLLGEVILGLQSRSQLKNETHSLAQPGYWDPHQ